jgi:hypothetical protein
MVRVWGGRVIRWGLLTLVGLIIVVFVGRLILQLEGRLRTEIRARQAAEGALAVDEAKLGTRDNLHVTVMAPQPQVTVTVAPAAPGAAGGATGSAGSSRVVTVPSPFAVPGPTVTARPTIPPPSPPPQVTVQNCPVVHLLILCL